MAHAAEAPEGFDVDMEQVARKASRDEFEKLKVHWKELQDAIFGMGEKPLRFLRYYIFSHYDVDVLREDEIYGWFAKNENVCGYGADPLGFAKELRRSAQAYQNYLCVSNSQFSG